MAKEVEIKTKLTLGKEAKTVLVDLRKGFKDVDKERKSTQKGFRDFARDAAAMAVGVNLIPAIRKMAGMATSLITVASASHDAQQGFAGLIAGMQKVPWEDARLEAERLHRAMRNISIQVGQVNEDVQEGFRAITTFLGGGVRAFDMAERNIGKITTIANTMGFTVANIGGEVGKMAAGFLSTESAVFNLLRGTGIFHSDITKVTMKWQELTSQERIQRLEGALSSVSDNLSAAAPTMSDLVNSFSEMGKLFLETMGAPVLEALIESFTELKDSMVGSKEEMIKFARGMGRDVGKWVRDAAKTMQDGFQYIRTHAQEIKEAIISAFKFARDTVGWILDHKTELAVAFGAHTLGSTALASALGGAISGGAKGVFAGGKIGAGFFTPGGTAAAAAAGGSMGMAAKVGTGVAGRIGLGGVLAGGGAAGGLAALTGLAVAAGAVTAVMWGLHEAVEQTMGSKTDEAEATARAMSFFKDIESGKGEIAKRIAGFEGITDAQRKEVAKMRAILVDPEGAADLGVNSRKLGEWADAMLNVQTANRRAVVDTERAIGQLQEYDKNLDILGKEMAKLGAEFGLDPAFVEAQQQKLDEAFSIAAVEQAAITEKVSSGFMTAIKTGNQGAAQHIASLLANSRNLHGAFISSADMTATGFRLLAEMVQEESENFAEMLERRARQVREEAQKPEAPRVSFSGGQVFKIQQDFRDQDPDRVAFVFQKGILAAAERRIQASTSSPFGT